MLPSDIRQFQTSHGRAQRRALGVLWLAVLGSGGLLGFLENGIWTFTGAVAFVVLGFYAFAAIRRNALGLYVGPDQVTVRGLVFKSTVQKGPAPIVRWQDQGGRNQFLLLRTRFRVWRRVQYLTHVTDADLWRRLYPAENQLLVRVAGSDWAPTGMVWTDETGADEIIKWLGLTAQPAKRNPADAIHPEDRLRSAQLVPMLAVMTAPLVVLSIIVVAFDSNVILVSLTAVIGGLASWLAYRRLDRLTKAKTAAREARNPQALGDQPV